VTVPAFSLRVRLTLLWSAVSLVVLLGLELLTVAVVSAELNATVDRDLALEARQYEQRVAGASGIDDLEERAAAFLREDAGDADGLAVVYRASFADGRVLSNSGDEGLRATMAAVPSAAAGRPATVRDPVHGDVRVAVIAIEQDGQRVGELRIAAPLSTIESTVGSLLTPLLVANAGLIALGGLIAYVVLGRGLAPVRTITSTAAGISEGDLSRRIGHRGPRDEVGTLAETFDAMLARLQGSFEQRQAFYALASHELRTPLTIVRGHLEVLRRTDRPEPEEVRETLDIALEELDRITDEVNDMLLLGRMLLGQPGPRQEVDAGFVLREVHRRARGLAVRDWQLDVAGPVTVRADTEQLSRALLNLVTNAVRHTHEGERVRLACRGSHGWAQLEVTDSGDGIPEPDLPHVFAPWYRVGARDGSVGGLGLMIVREVARAHGGDVQVASRERAGTTFTIRLPLVESAPAPSPAPERTPVPRAAGGAGRAAPAPPRVR